MHPAERMLQLLCLPSSRTELAGKPFGLFLSDRNKCLPVRCKAFPVGMRAPGASALFESRLELASGRVDCIWIIKELSRLFGGHVNVAEAASPAGGC